MNWFSGRKVDLPGPADSSLRRQPAPHSPTVRVFERPEGFGDIGFGAVQDNPGRCRHEIDVLAMAGRRVTAIGEAKATLDRRGLADLERLERIKQLLTDLGHEATEAVLLLFSTTGFTSDLERATQGRSDIRLIDLDRMYG
ncbi:hypothetical protein [Nocardia sp. BMG51109]|uniref:hypothetical protein n=1 Tax=Nocardia sp. BMG51109 TaxID=1056816 RepID=UPI000467BD56|nr:hypothetical protein [Nocardia sp. BMG51109]